MVPERKITASPMVVMMRARIGSSTIGRITIRSTASAKRTEKTMAPAAVSQGLPSVAEAMEKAT